MANPIHQQIQNLIAESKNKILQKIPIAKVSKNFNHKTIMAVNKSKTPTTIKEALINKVSVSNLFDDFIKSRSIQSLNSKSSCLRSFEKKTPDVNRSSPRKESVKKPTRSENHRRSNEGSAVFSLSSYDRRLIALENQAIEESIKGYLDLLDDIINKDYVFGKYLKRIRIAINQWRKTCNAAFEQIKYLELQLLSKNSIIQTFVSNTKHDISELGEYADTKDVQENGKNTFYTFMPNEDWEGLKADNEKLRLRVHFLEDQVKSSAENEEKLLSKLQSLENQVKSSANNEEKLNNLMHALKNRGYPIDDIFRKELHWNTLHKTLETLSEPAQFIIKIDESLISSSESSFTHSPASIH